MNFGQNAARYAMAEECRETGKEERQEFRFCLPGGEISCKSEVSMER